MFQRELEELVELRSYTILHPSGIFAVLIESHYLKLDYGVLLKLQTHFWRLMRQILYSSMLVNMQVSISLVALYVSVFDTKRMRDNCA